MKDLTIYNVYVEMESQEQCDRMKKLCIDNVLPIWEHYENKMDIAFLYERSGNVFRCCEKDNEFFVFPYQFFSNPKLKTLKKVTEEQFIELLKK